MSLRQGRRIGPRSVSVRATAELQSDDAGEHERDGNELEHAHSLAKPDHADRDRASGADTGPDRVGRANLEMLQSRGEQPKAGQREDREQDRRPSAGESVTEFETDREAGLE